MIYKNEPNKKKIEHISISKNTRQLRTQIVDNMELKK